MLLTYALITRLLARLPEDAAWWALRPQGSFPLCLNALFFSLALQKFSLHLYINVSDFHYRIIFNEIIFNENSKIFLESPHHLFSVMLYTFSLSTIILELFSPKTLFTHWWIHHYKTLALCSFYTYIYVTDVPITYFPALPILSCCIFSSIYENIWRFMKAITFLSFSE